MAKRKPKKSDFYKLRNKLGISIEQTAELCGVTERSIQNWDSKGAPLMATRLLWYYDSKNINYPGWRGWEFTREGVLRNKRLKVSITPDWLSKYELVINRFLDLKAEKEQLNGSWAYRMFQRFERLTAKIKRYVNSKKRLVRGW